MEVTSMTQAPANIHCGNQRKKHKTRQGKTSWKVLEISKETHHPPKYKQQCTRNWRGDQASCKAVWKGNAHEFVDPAATDTVKIEMKNENWRTVAQNFTNFLFSYALLTQMRPPRSCLCSQRELGLCPGPQRWKVNVLTCSTGSPFPHKPSHVSFE